MKKTSGLLIVVLSMVLALCMPVIAAQKKAEKAEVAKITCTSAGKVNVSFKSDVEWEKDAAAVVKNEDGKELAASLVKKNNRLAAVAVKGMVKGQTYTVEISGVRAKGSKEAAAVSGSFKAKKLKTAIKTSKPAVNKKVIIIKFKGKAAYKDLAVTVTDASGKELDAKIVKKTKSQIKVKVPGLEKGKTYKITVNGVKLKKEANFAAITRTFKVKK